jgi:ring-1,2-phenylacetyl-CoA epoxidase subunit PaaD
LFTKEQILFLLEEVKDPEIPVLSLIDMGVITKVTVENEKVTVNMTPTFTGCPAMEYMKNDVIRVLKNNGITDFEVNINFDEPWSSNKISERGLKALKDFGLAPPMKYDVIPDISIIEHSQCPYCNSDNTELRNPFGPTLCRAMHYCNNCRQMFEQFKPL